MASETGNRMCSEEELITAILESGSAKNNRQVLEDLFKQTSSGDIIVLDCETRVSGFSGKYEVIGRIQDKYDPDGDIPFGMNIQRKDSPEYVPYCDIRSFQILVPQTLTLQNS